MPTLLPTLMPVFMYLLTGHSGCYDEASTWVVATFFDLDEAKAYRDLASGASQEAIAAYRKTSESKYVFFDEPTRYDLAHCVRDTEVRYRIEPVPLVQGAMRAEGVFSVAGAFTDETARTRVLNGFRGKAPLPATHPVPAPAERVTGAFASKLAFALDAAFGAPPVKVAAGMLS